jgi:hypothetical protein
VYVASQRLEDLLMLLINDGKERPLVVTSRDRLDIVLGLLASQVRRCCTHVHAQHAYALCVYCACTLFT